METFFTVIFFLIAGFWLAGIVGRWLLRRWLLKKQQEIRERFSGAGEGYTYKQYSWTGRTSRQSGSNSPNEGEVKINRQRAQEKKVNRSIGEYVEFEEVEVIEETEN